MSLHTEIDLFDPDDDSEPCETCGYSYDQLSFSLNYDAGDEGSLFTASTSIGCYGGDSCTTDSVCVVRHFLLDVADRFPHVADDIRGLVDFLVGVYG